MGFFGFGRQPKQKAIRRPIYVIFAFCIFLGSARFRFFWQQPRDSWSSVALWFLRILLIRPVKFDTSGPDSDVWVNGVWTNSLSRTKNKQSTLPRGAHSPMAFGQDKMPANFLIGFFCLEGGSEPDYYYYNSNRSVWSRHESVHP